jgi:hypothetical protein
MKLQSLNSLCISPVLFHLFIKKNLISILIKRDGDEKRWIGEWAPKRRPRSDLSCGYLALPQRSDHQNKPKLLGAKNSSSETKSMSFVGTKKASEYE